MNPMLAQMKPFKSSPDRIRILSAIGLALLSATGVSAESTAPEYDFYICANVNRN